MSRKISVTLPDDLHAAAAAYGAKNARSVPNLCAFALRLYMSKYALLHAPKRAVPGDRNAARTGVGGEGGSVDVRGLAREAGPA